MAEVAHAKFRVQQVLQHQAAFGKALDDMLCSWFKDEPIPGGAPLKEFNGLASAAVFGVSSNFEAPATEPGFQGCFRLSCKGTRVVLMVTLSDFLNHLDKGGGESKLTLAEVRRRFQNLTKLSMETMFGPNGSCKLWCGTVGSNDVLWLPSGMMMYEIVLHSFMKRSLQKGIYCIS